MSTWTDVSDYHSWIANGRHVNTNVKYISLVDGDITEIDASIENLPNIVQLNLCNNMLTTLPVGFGKLHALTNLNLNGNRLASIPDAIWSLHKLNVLILSDNQLETISSQIETLQNLEFLSLSDNQLLSLPDEIGNLQLLNGLEINTNRFTLFPKALCNLTELSSLELSDNQISIIPSEIEKLTKLSGLTMSRNLLTQIPPEICTLVEMQVLTLDDNRITEIPDGIENLQELEQFDISNNQLTTVPASLGNLPNIDYINVIGNPIEYIPPNVTVVFETQIIQDVAHGVYGDSQSVHNNTVQTSIKDSIERIIACAQTMTSADVLSVILTDSDLTEFAKQSLVEYSRCHDLIGSLNLTFLDVLTAVWNRIVTNTHSKEIKLVLNTEMSDSECKCFTGRVSRLLNCLSGFDELVEVKIADNEQIGNVIAMIGERLKQEGKYSTSLHKEVAREELIGLGYTEEVVDGWIDYIE